MTGTQAAEYIFSTIIPKIQACANQGRGTSFGKARLAAQIDCVRAAFGKS